jgi:hypothetical protein
MRAMDEREILAAARRLGRRSRRRQRTLLLVVAASVGASVARAQAVTATTRDSSGACSWTDVIRDSGGRSPRTDTLGRRDSVAFNRNIATARQPDIRLFASVSASEVRFAAQPRIRVRLCNGGLDSAHVLERRNLPSPVQVGTTYRNVYVAVEILGHLNALCLSGLVTGQRTDTTRAGTASSPCVSLGISDSTGAIRSPSAPRRPPQ